MRKMLTFAVVGGAVGAGTAFLRSGTQATEAPETGNTAQAAGSLVPVAACGAATGAALGFLLDRRAKAKLAKRTKQAAALALAAEAARRAKDAAIAARPVVEKGAEMTREKAVDFAQTAAPVVKKAATVAKHRAEERALVAKHRVGERLIAA
jgi:hypothetical protein